jgi:hypothetical protein
MKQESDESSERGCGSGCVGTVCVLLGAFVGCTVDTFRNFDTLFTSSRGPGLGIIIGAVVGVVVYLLWSGMSPPRGRFKDDDSEDRSPGHE